MNVWKDIRYLDDHLIQMYLLGTWPSNLLSHACTPAQPQGHMPVAKSPSWEGTTKKENRGRLHLVNKCGHPFFFLGGGGGRLVYYVVNNLGYRLLLCYLVTRTAPLCSCFSNHSPSFMFTCSTCKTQFHIQGLYNAHTQKCIIFPHTIISVPPRD